ncbi:bifunctional diaminohydroxyphosphoribosylaminopyrimidine deaminase/5-amino-6-(5-phosphoribosylamino)uracil reductase RibD [Seonamhaeicola sediminis]|uniref:Riboflavin biosynthesis protein RibD n=1 Tax=Seonamhaeicola sediminis TaxID=2528206 RepID=A0A562Y9Y4_9FLAO|nr:bifunctional diaminohydroxyphosphoribosylaminopyrimidine deaminase/5-amino-6-(5-phosphoribosylamino)uracil reductase RibD [Seonamhaeicola sediminis]TWO30889.1 bifunctional diaminohydroxyphosphoribosylaminopyrimidine deaminase/5-amino-6-(5-phosphoribosylamino)uracil reductase RibD [Seonamhaeicola sediminis]
MANHEIYIQRCIEIGKKGLGTTRPNPMVGAVIVLNNKIIGEGYTSIYGGNHAEVNAIHSVKNKALLKNATLYVTLEPCSHFGKTPPCSELIIKHSIPNVVIGCTDDNELVAGKGIKRLKEAGTNVIVGILERECKEHHKRFFTFHNKKRPYIILKWAETNDGFIAPETKDGQKPVWISNTYSRQLVHKWRTEEQAILVGTNTVIQDNPSLTVREWTGINPIRVVLDGNLKLSQDFNVFDNASKTIVITDKEVTSTKSNVFEEVVFYGSSLAHEVCNSLFEHQINSVIIEGGSKTLQTFIDENLWDEARVFKGNTSFKKGTKAPIVNGKLVSEQNIATDILKIYKND